VSGPPIDVLTLPEEVAALGREVAGEAWVGLAVETNEVHAYHARVCLIQIALRDRVVLIDAKALRGRPFPLRPLDEALRASTPGLVVHGGEYLVAGLKRDFQIAPAGLFDTQQAASLLGWPRTGYRALARERLGAEVPAPASVDWASRPLPPEALEVAAARARHLLALRDLLSGAVRAADLEEEVAIASEEVAWTSGEIHRFDPDGFVRLKGARRLTDRALQVLRALYLWREAKARDLDVPPGRLLPNRAMVDLARHPESAIAMVERAAFHSRLLFDDRRQLREAVVRALSAPVELPEIRERPPPDEARRVRTARLKAWRAQEAEARGIGLQAVLPRKSLDYLAIHGATALGDVPMLGQRRRARYGEHLAALCDVAEPPPWSTE